MENSFFKKKPLLLHLYKNNTIQQIQTNDEGLLQTEMELDASKFKLDYKIYNNINNNIDIDYDTIINFINTNYVNSNYVNSKDELFKFVYTKDLLKFYCRDAIIIEFYPANNKKIIGYIIGRREKLSIYSNIVDNCEINFLCITQKLRNLYLGAYIINILIKEVVIQWNIAVFNYTLGKQTKSKYYANKNFFHRLINIETLVNVNFINNININEYKKKYNNFIYTKKFKDNTIMYINNNLNLDVELNKDLIQNLYTKILEYKANTYDIYDLLNINDFTETFKNNAFHHFIIKDNDIIINYICMYRLDSINQHNNLTYKNGYLYYMFFNKNDIDNDININNSLELIFEYIYKQEIFDVITFADIFNFDITNIIQGSGILYYHCANILISKIDNFKIGLITI